MEEHFINTRYFLPSCHKGYWLGYKATTWPKFKSLVSRPAQSPEAACKTRRVSLWAVIPSPPAIALQLN